MYLSVTLQSELIKYWHEMLMMAFKRNKSDYVMPGCFCPLATVAAGRCTNPWTRSIVAELRL